MDNTKKKGLVTRIHPSAIVEEGAEVGEGSQIWHFCHVRKGSELGEQCILGKGVYIDCGVKLGNRVKIQNNVSVYKGVTIGDGVFVGPHVCFTNDKLPRAVNSDLTLKSASDWDEGKTTVGTGASIGANATIVTGITLGDWCMVGAGSVVTRDVPSFALVQGNPARIVGYVDEEGKIVRRVEKKRAA